MQPTDGDDDAREKGVSIWFVRSQCRVSICLITHTHTLMVMAMAAAAVAVKWVVCVSMSNPPFSRPFSLRPHSYGWLVLIKALIDLYLICLYSSALSALPDWLRYWQFFFHLPFFHSFLLPVLSVQSPLGANSILSKASILPPEMWSLFKCPPPLLIH